MRVAGFAFVLVCSVQSCTYSAPMEVDPQITLIESRARAAGVKMAAVLRDAGVAATTWWRWREGAVEPKLGTLRKVEAALERRLSNPDQRAA